MTTNKYTNENTNKKVKRAKSSTKNSQNNETTFPYLPKINTESLDRNQNLVNKNFESNQNLYFPLLKKHQSTKYQKTSKNPKMVTNYSRNMRPQSLFRKKNPVNEEQENEQNTINFHLPKLNKSSVTDYRLPWKNITNLQQNPYFNYKEIINSSNTVKKKNKLPISQNNKNPVMTNPQLLMKSDYMQPLQTHSNQRVNNNKVLQDEEKLNDVSCYRQQRSYSQQLKKTSENKEDESNSEENKLLNNNTQYHLEASSQSQKRENLNKKIPTEDIYLDVKKSSSNPVSLKEINVIIDQLLENYSQLNSNDQSVILQNLAKMIESLNKNEIFEDLVSICMFMTKINKFLLENKDQLNVAFDLFERNKPIAQEDCFTNQSGNKLELNKVASNISASSNFSNSSASTNHTNKSDNKSDISDRTELASSITKNESRVDININPTQLSSVFTNLENHFSVLCIDLEKTIPDNGSLKKLNHFLEKFEIEYKKLFTFQRNFKNLFKLHGEKKNPELLANTINRFNKKDNTQKENISYEQYLINQTSQNYYEIYFYQTIKKQAFTGFDNIVKFNRKLTEEESRRIFVNTGLDNMKSSDLPHAKRTEYYKHILLDYIPYYTKHIENELFLVYNELIISNLDIILPDKTLSNKILDNTEATRLLDLMSKIQEEAYKSYPLNALLTNENKNSKNDIETLKKFHTEILTSLESACAEGFPNVEEEKTRGQYNKIITKIKLPKLKTPSLSYPVIDFYSKYIETKLKYINSLLSKPLELNKIGKTSNELSATENTNQLFNINKAINKLTGGKTDITYDQIITGVEKTFLDKATITNIVNKIPQKISIRFKGIEKIKNKLPIKFVDNYLNYLEIIIKEKVSNEIKGVYKSNLEKNVLVQNIETNFNLLKNNFDPQELLKSELVSKLIQQKTKELYDQFYFKLGVDLTTIIKEALTTPINIALIKFTLICIKSVKRNLNENKEHISLENYKNLYTQCSTSIDCLTTRVNVHNDKELKKENLRGKFETHFRVKNMIQFNTLLTADEQVMVKEEFIQFYRSKINTAKDFTELRSIRDNIFLNSYMRNIKFDPIKKIQEQLDLILNNFQAKTNKVIGKKSNELDDKDFKELDEESFKELYLNYPKLIKTLLQTNILQNTHRNLIKENQKVMLPAPLKKLKSIAIDKIREMIKAKIMDNIDKNVKYTNLLEDSVLDYNLQIPSWLWSEGEFKKNIRSKNDHYDIKTDIYLDNKNITFKDLFNAEEVDKIIGEVEGEHIKTKLEEEEISFYEQLNYINHQNYNKFKIYLFNKNYELNDIKNLIFNDLKKTPDLITIFKATLSNHAETVINHFTLLQKDQEAQKGQVLFDLEEGFSNNSRIEDVFSQNEDKLTTEEKKLYNIKKIEEEHTNDKMKQILKNIRIKYLKNKIASFYEHKSGSTDETLEIINDWKLEKDLEIQANKYIKTKEKEVRDLIFDLNNYLTIYRKDDDANSIKPFFDVLENAFFTLTHIINGLVSRGINKNIEEKIVNLYETTALELLSNFTNEYNKILVSLKGQGKITSSEFDALRHEEIFITKITSVRKTITNACKLYEDNIGDLRKIAMITRVVSMSAKDVQDNKDASWYDTISSTEGKGAGPTQDLQQKAGDTGNEEVSWKHSTDNNEDISYTKDHKTGFDFLDLIMRDYCDTMRYKTSDTTHTLIDLRTEEEIDAAEATEKAAKENKTAENKTWLNEVNDIAKMVTASPNTILSFTSVLKKTFYERFPPAMIIKLLMALKKQVNKYQSMSAIGAFLQTEHANCLLTGGLNPYTKVSIDKWAKDRCNTILARYKMNFGLNTISAAFTTVAMVGFYALAVLIRETIDLLAFAAGKIWKGMKNVSDWLRDNQSTKGWNRDELALTLVNNYKKLGVNERNAKIQKYVDLKILDKEKDSHMIQSLTTMQATDLGFVNKANHSDENVANKDKKIQDKMKVDLAWFNLERKISKHLKYVTAT